MAVPTGCLAGGSSVMIMVKDIGIITPPQKPCRARKMII